MLQPQQMKIDKMRSRVTMLQTLLPYHLLTLINGLKLYRISTLSNNLGNSHTLTPKIEQKVYIANRRIIVEIMVIVQQQLITQRQYFSQYGQIGNRTSPITPKSTKVENSLELSVESKVNEANLLLLGPFFEMLSCWGHLKWG